VLWTGIDSQFFLLITAATLPPSIPSPLSCPDGSDDDDDMLDLTSAAVPLQAIRRKDPHPLPQILQKRTFSDLSTCQLARLLGSATAALCEHDCRNGFRTPLRC
jgi:hypothetical protein